MPAPAPSEGFPIDELDRLLRALPQPSEMEAKTFLEDIRAVTDRLLPEPDPWDDQAP